MRENEQLVSIVIPLYNAEPYIEETINSILEQTYKNIEIIIIDDESTDNSYKIAKKYENKFIQVVTQKNSGPGAARNKGILLSKGQYIQFLDADDLLEKNKIKNQLEIFKKYGDDCFIFGKVIEFKNNINDNSNITQYQDYYKSYKNPLDLLKDYWQKGGMIATGSYIVSKELINISGKWNENWILNEDGEFVSRLISNSNKIIYDEKSITYYRKSNPNSLNSNRTLKHYQSQFESYKSYGQIINKKNLDNNFNYALASCYSGIYQSMYPHHKELRSECIEELNKLGYKKVIPRGHPYFKYIASIIGINNALFIKQIIKKLNDYFRIYKRKNLD